VEFLNSELRELVEEGAVEDRHKRELTDPEGPPLLGHQLRRIHLPETCDYVVNPVKDKKKETVYSY